MGSGLVATVAVWAGLAGGPRDDVVAAYSEAAEQMRDGDSGAALATLSGAVARARAAGAHAEPLLAEIHVMRAGLMLEMGYAEGDVYFACLQGVRLDSTARPPRELDTTALRLTCDRARLRVSTGRTLPAAKRPPPPPRRRRRPRSPHPRVMISLGIGTGVGVAHGPVEQTYKQFRDLSTYSNSDATCATARWAAGPLQAPTSQQEFLSLLQLIGQAAPGALPEGADTFEGMRAFAGQYDPVTCRQKETVSPGLALAPFHIAPEVSVRVFKSLYVSAYARVQVVTGSRVRTDDPQQPYGASFQGEVRSATPPGSKRRLPVTWAMGLKLKHYFGAKRLRPFVGGFAGVGTARLRVPLGFANDHNGNSVPDNRERAATGPLDENGNLQPDTCVNVWPYRGCSSNEDHALATAVATPGRARQRVDTIKLGPMFVGGLGGVHYQISRHFALTAEVQLGMWFPRGTSLLADVTTGPVVTF